MLVSSSDAVPLLEVSSLSEFGLNDGGGTAKLPLTAAEKQTEPRQVCAVTASALPTHGGSLQCTVTIACALTTPIDCTLAHLNSVGCEAGPNDTLFSCVKLTMLSEKATICPPRVLLTTSGDCVSAPCTMLSADVAKEPQRNEPGVLMQGAPA